MTNLAHIWPLLFEPGDRLSRDEFLKAWEQMPDLKFAELIDGVVYMPSPLSVEHGSYDALAQTWATVYAGQCGVARTAHNIAWMMLESAPQPDIALWIRPEFGGRSTIERELAAGAPELAFEIAKSSRSYDLGPKLKLYERAVVKEYVAALVKERRIEWRALRNGRYEMLGADASGVYKSNIFPGLWLNQAAFWDLDIPGVLATLEQGLQSAEFAAFQAQSRTR